MSIERWVFHVDMDQFLVGVELLRRPELIGRPVVVGGRGDPTERGVVSTASYEARAFGVRSGMPLRTALKRCPEAVFLPVDGPVYEAASAEVMTTLQHWPGAVVEVLGWDEAFVGVETDDPDGTAHGLRAAVLEATDLSCSVGIGDTLVRAKIATDFGKPAGVYRLTRDNWLEVMGQRPTTALWGVGKRTAERLQALGIETVADLAVAEEATLVAAFGPAGGGHLGRLGRGGGRAWPDDTPWIPRAHGHEHTFQQDLTAEAEVRAALAELADRVLADLRREGRACARVHLKARFVPFLTFTRVRKLPEPTWDREVLADTAWALFEKLQATEFATREAPGPGLLRRPVRLLV
ncbi:MAG: DNA polymerase IV, partial [Nocardioides sp.]